MLDSELSELYSTHTHTHTNTHNNKRKTKLPGKRKITAGHMAGKNKMVPAFV